MKQLAKFSLLLVTVFCAFSVYANQYCPATDTFDGKTMAFSHATALDAITANHVKCFYGINEYKQYTQYLPSNHGGQGPLEGQWYVTSYNPVAGNESLICNSNNPLDCPFSKINLAAQYIKYTARCHNAHL